MGKFRIPRKKKKYWKKRGLALILPTQLRGEFVEELVKIMKQPYSAPFTDAELSKYPLKETEVDYIWEIQK